MLTFVSVFVLAVIGTQAAPQFQPADAAQQPNVPSVQILTQTDSIGADGSFNNRCDSSCNKTIQFQFFNVKKSSSFSVLKPPTVSNSKILVSLKEF